MNLAPTIAGILLAVALALPLAWKWQLGARRVALAVAAIGLVVGAVLVLLSDALVPAGDPWRTVMVTALTLTIAAGVLAYRFYRDPERTVPVGDGLIVSPADGEVVYVRRSRDGVLPVATKHGRDIPLVELTRTPLAERDAVVVGIGMSFLDVHVNRAPVAGRVTVHHHVPGRFGSLRHPDAVFENERATTVIETDGIEIAVVQIASRLVRQIVAFVRAGESVAAGQRIGAIRFGSQVDLVLPAVDALDIRVEAGQRVRAGETVIAAIPSRRGAVATVASAFERAVPAGTAAPAPGGSA